MPDGSTKPPLFAELFKAKRIVPLKRFGPKASRKGQGKGRDADGDGITNEAEKKKGKGKPKAAKKIEPNHDATTFSPEHDLPKQLHGVAFKPWDDAPTDLAGWAAVEGQAKISEPPMPEPTKGKGLGTGVIIREPDGRVWLTKPTNGFGGYSHTFPKGGVEEGLSPQANAIKEAFEETGLQVRITGYATDVERTTSVARYYYAERVGGTPAAAGWESEAVVLAPPSKLHEFLNMGVDQRLAHEHLGAPKPPAPPPKPEPKAAQEKPFGHGLTAPQYGIGKLPSYEKPGQGHLFSGKGKTSDQKAKQAEAAAIFSGKWGNTFGFKKAAGRALLFNEVYVPSGTPLDFDALFSLEKAAKGGGKRKGKMAKPGAAGGVPGASGRKGNYGAKAGQTIAGNLCRGPNGGFAACGVGGGSAKAHSVKHDHWPAHNSAAVSAKKHIAKMEAAHAAGDHEGLKALTPNMDALLPGKGNPYTKAKAQAFKELHDDLMKQHAAKTVAAAAAGPADTKGWTVVGKQLGSNPGAQMVDAQGVKHYAKFVPSTEHAKNEVLAGKLYALAGTPALSTKLIDTNPIAQVVGAAGAKPGIGVASEWAEKSKFDYSNPAHVSAAHEDFAVHAWMANWDSVGTGMDNLAMVGGKMTLVDAGGSMLFRAQGGPKGKAFGPSTVEWDTMRSSATPGDAPKVYGKMDAAALFNSAKKVAAIPDKAIRDVVMAHAPGTDAERYALAEQMVARKHDVIARANKLGMGDVTKPAADITPEPAKVSAPVAPSVAKPATVDVAPKAVRAAAVAAAPAAAPAAAFGKITSADVDAVVMQHLPNGKGSAYVLATTPNSYSGKLVAAALANDKAGFDAIDVTNKPGAAKLKAKLEEAWAKAPVAAAPAAAAVGLPKIVPVTTKAPAMAGSFAQGKVDAMAAAAAKGNVTAVAGAGMVPPAAKPWQIETLQQMGALPPGIKKLSSKQLDQIMLDKDMQAAIDAEPPGSTFGAQSDLIYKPVASGDLAMIAYGMQMQATPAGKLMAAKVYAALGGKPLPVGAVAPAAVTGGAKKLSEGEVVGVLARAGILPKNPTDSDMADFKDAYGSTKWGQAVEHAKAGDAAALQALVFKPNSKSANMQAGLLAAMKAPAAAARPASVLSDAEIDTHLGGGWSMAALKADPNMKGSATMQMVQAAKKGDLAALQAVSTTHSNMATETKAKLIAAVSAKQGAASLATGPVMSMSAGQSLINPPRPKSLTAADVNAHLADSGSGLTVSDYMKHDPGSTSKVGKMVHAAMKGDMAELQAITPSGSISTQLKPKLLAAMGAPAAAATPAVAAPEASLSVKTPPALPVKLTSDQLSTPANAVPKKMAQANDTMHEIADSYAAGKVDAATALDALGAVEKMMPPSPNTYWKKVAKNHAAIKSSIAQHAGAAQAAAANAAPAVAAPTAAGSQGKATAASAASAKPKALTPSETSDIYQANKDAFGVTHYGNDMSVTDEMYFAAKAGNFDKVKAAQPKTAAGQAFQGKLMAAMTGSAPPAHPVTAPPPLVTAAAPPPAPKPTAKAAPAPKFNPANLDAPPDFNKWKEKGGAPLSSNPLQNAANNQGVQEVYALALKGDLAALKAGTFTELDVTTGQPTGKTPPMDQHPSKWVKSYHADLVKELDMQLNPPRPVKLDTIVQSGEWDEIDKALPSVPPGKAVAAVSKSHKVGNYIVLGQAQYGHPLPKPDDTVIGGAAWKSAALDHYKKAPHAARDTFSTYLSSSGASQLNTNLRHGNLTPKVAGKSVEQHMKDFNALLVDVPEGATFSRSMGQKGYGQTPKPQDIADLQQFLLTAQKGTTVQEPGFTSSSWSGGNQILSNNDIQWKFTAGKGVKVFPAWLGANTGEGEGLFPPNQRYLIVGAKKVGKTVVVDAILLPTHPN